MAQKNLLNLVHDTLAKGSVLSMATVTPIVELMPFTEISGNAYTYNVIDELLPTEHRELGADVEAAEMQTKKDTVELCILTNSSKVDRALNIMQNITDIQAEAQDLAMKSSGYALEKKVLERLEEYLSTEKAGVKFEGALNLDILLDARESVLGLDASNGAIFCNTKMLRKIKNVAAAQDGYITNMEQFGKNVSAFDNIPVVASPQVDENAIYFVKFADDGVHGITNKGLQVYNYDRGVHLVTDTEMLYNVVAKTKNSFAKIEVNA